MTRQRRMNMEGVVTGRSVHKEPSAEEVEPSIEDVLLRALDQGNYNAHELLRRAAQELKILKCTHENCTGNADGSASCADCGGLLPDCLPPLLFKQAKEAGEQQNAIVCYQGIIQSLVTHLGAAAQCFREYEREHQRKVDDILASTDQSRIDAAIAKLRRNASMALYLETAIVQAQALDLDKVFGSGKMTIRSKEGVVIEKTVKTPWDNFRLCHCDLSGEIYLLEVKDGRHQGCELCDKPEPATPEKVKQALDYLNQQNDRLINRLSDNIERSKHPMG